MRVLTNPYLEIYATIYRLDVSHSRTNRPACNWKTISCVAKILQDQAYLECNHVSKLNQS
jgi:hypothetical protein